MDVAHRAPRDPSAAAVRGGTRSATRYWRLVLLGQVLLGVLIADALVRGGWVSGWAAVLVAPLFVALFTLLFVGASLLITLFSEQHRPRGPRAWLLLRTWLSEASEFALAEWLMAIDPERELAGAGAARTQGRPVLLVHGILCNRGIWRSVERRLLAAGYGPIRTVSLEPLLGDIEMLAGELAREVRELRRAARGAPRVAIVAHSLGGLVARAYLRAHGAADVSALVTIATPHHGSAHARLGPGPAARQMRRGSAWLAQLNRDQEGRWPVPVTSLYSLEDTLVGPPDSSALDGATMHVTRGVGHMGILRSGWTADRILHALRETAAPGTTP